SGKEHYIVIAEGLFMYLKEDEIKTLIGRLKQKIGGYTLIFDAYSTLTAKHANNHPALKKTGAKINWGIDDPEALERWGMRFIEEQYFTSGTETRRLSFGTRMIFSMADLFATAKKAHRILIYQVT
ncbi:MAG: hypothetical protein PHO15_03940, partial [Eubacteriales bacterium]|nr:hypothetical protein [Eubacteriales bacterium]